jgi:hypothetical protein
MTDNRKGYEFSDRVKQSAFQREVLAGNIPPDANMADYDFHHILSIAAGKGLDLPKFIIKSGLNCEPLLRGDHAELDHSQSVNIDHLPVQPKLFEP